MTFDEKIKALKDCLYLHCSLKNCKECDFYDVKDEKSDGYNCGIRDNNGNIPYYNDWNMKVALGLEKPYNPLFPEEVRQSIKQHFERVE